MSIGIWQLVLILVIVFVIFGAGKLPGMMGDVGKGIKNLKEGIKGENDDEEESEEEAPKIEKAPEKKKKK